MKLRLRVFNDNCIVRVRDVWCWGALPMQCLICDMIYTVESIIYTASLIRARARIFVISLLWSFGAALRSLNIMCVCVWVALIKCIALLDSCVLIWPVSFSRKIYINTWCVFTACIIAFVFIHTCRIRAWNRHSILFDLHACIKSYPTNVYQYDLFTDTK
jgi:hypothetical protein